MTDEKLGELLTMVMEKAHELRNMEVPQGHNALASADAFHRLADVVYHLGVIVVDMREKTLNK